MLFVRKGLDTTAGFGELVAKGLACIGPGELGGGVFVANGLAAVGTAAGVGLGTWSLERCARNTLIIALVISAEPDLSVNRMALAC